MSYDIRCALHPDLSFTVENVRICMRSKAAETTKATENGVEELAAEVEVALMKGKGYTDNEGERADQGKRAARRAGRRAASLGSAAKTDETAEGQGVEQAAHDWQRGQQACDLTELYVEIGQYQITFFSGPAGTPTGRRELQQPAVPELAGQLPEA
ncbi:hypothetical protein EIP86_009342 [Pleurotus ostreatoroseus]|nr:hypothetical protein EIP86_009342 [Pleurotus ostreatoroseus]